MEQFIVKPQTVTEIARHNELLLNMFIGTGIPTRVMDSELPPPMKRFKFLSRKLTSARSEEQEQAACEPDVNSELQCYYTQRSATQLIWMSTMPWTSGRTESLFIPDSPDLDMILWQLQPHRPMWRGCSLCVVSWRQGSATEQEWPSTNACFWNWIVTFFNARLPGCLVTVMMTQYNYYCQ